MPRKSTTINSDDTPLICASCGETLNLDDLSAKGEPLFRDRRGPICDKCMRREIRESIKKAEITVPNRKTAPEVTEGRLYYEEYRQRVGAESAT